MENAWAGQGSPGQGWGMKKLLILDLKNYKTLHKVSICLYIIPKKNLFKNEDIYLKTVKCNGTNVGVYSKIVNKQLVVEKFG